MVFIRGRLDVLSPSTVDVDCRSIVGKSSEVTLGVLVPCHSGQGMLPPPLHRLQRILVRIVTPGDDALQMLILSLDDLVSGISLEREVTWPAQLFTRHRLHSLSSFHCGWPVNEDEFKRSAPHGAVPVGQIPRPSRSGLRDAN